MLSSCIAYICIPYDQTAEHDPGNQNLTASRVKRGTRILVGIRAEILYRSILAKRYEGKEIIKIKRDARRRIQMCGS